MNEQPAGPGTFAGDTVADVLARTHAWFHDNSGWAPPDEATIGDWLADDVCRAPDECLVRPRSWCPHGLASWVLILEELAEIDTRAQWSRTSRAAARAPQVRSVGGRPAAPGGPGPAPPALGSPP